MALDTPPSTSVKSVTKRQATPDDEVGKLQLDSANRSTDSRHACKSALRGLAA